MNRFFHLGLAAIVVAQLGSGAALGQYGSRGACQSSPKYAGGYGYRPVCPQPRPDYGYIGARPPACNKPAPPAPAPVVDPPEFDEAPIVTPGEKVTLDAEAVSYGRQPGFVTLHLGRTCLPATIIDWRPEAVTFIIPEARQEGPARLVVALCDRREVDSLDVQLAAAPLAADTGGDLADGHSPLDPLLGLWQAVTADAEGNVNKVLMDMLPGGNARLTVPTGSGGTATVEGKVSLDDGNLNLDLGSRVLTVGRVLSATSDRVVLQRGEGRINFTRP